jgi:hypothetical protein
MTDGVEDTLKAITAGAQQPLRQIRWSIAPPPLRDQRHTGRSHAGMPAPVVARRAPAPALQETEDDAVDA